MGLLAGRGKKLLFVQNKYTATTILFNNLNFYFFLNLFSATFNYPSF